MNNCRDARTVWSGRTNSNALAGRSHQCGADPGGRLGFALGTVLGLGVLSTLAGAPAWADDGVPPVTVGAGVRASFDVDSPDAGKDTDDFNLDSIRLYVNGAVTSNIKFTFDTEYQGSPEAGAPGNTNSVAVLDAIARFEFSDELNIWAGRFLPPTDRANLYGPYYANQWQVYNDGVQDGYPSEATGRDNGVAYWGQFGMLKVSAGAFDVPSTLGTDNVVWAERLQLDLWDPEPGYYLNGTYYGDKDILAIGVAGQQEARDYAYTGDFLLEKKLPYGGVISVEAEAAKYYKFGGYELNPDGTTPVSGGAYGLVSYLFPQQVGIGKIELLGKYAHAAYDFDNLIGGGVGQKTYDFEVGYIIKEFNARVALYYTDIKYDQDINGLVDHKLYGLGVQLQM
ncbi:MAG TPA: porin [Steroidobacteraceae bacterium]|nr:porin [Steroidobacteraceae bacterium]